MTPTIRQALDAVRGGRHASAVLDDLFRATHPNERTASDLRAALHAAIRAEGMPAWMRARIMTSWPRRGAALIDALMRDAPVYVRVNTLKATRDAVRDALYDHEPSECDLDEALRIARPFGLFRTDAFQQGWFEQQDLASQRVSHALDVLPGMRVIDACAGAGGKTLHIAALMQGRGRIIALDISEVKLQTLRTRAARAGVDIIETRPITSTKTVKRLASSADRVLIDAPCSGTGVLRRNPDIMLHATEEMLTELLDTQAGILRRSAMAVKAGGLVVYATCSLLKEESEAQVQRFVHEHPAFVVEQEWRTMPDDVQEDGFYVGVLRRVN